MQSWGIDFAWTRPSLSALIHGGVRFVGRYLSNDPSKNLDRHEYLGYRAHGIGIVVAWETTANRALSGQGAGEDDARRALAEAAAVGLPENVPICMAVDFDANGPDVWHYFTGARRILRGRCGAYGGYRVVRYLFDNGVISFAWQTYAWSGGLWDRRAMVRQYSNGHGFAGADVDYDVAIGPLTVGGAPAPAPAEHLLLEPERRLVNTYNAYIGHPRLHAHGLRVTRERMVQLRKLIWLAAVKGSDGHGGRLPRGWGVRNRAARYHLLWRYTRGL